MRPVTVLTLLSLAFTVGADAQAEPARLQKKKPPTLAVVRTWGDLFDQPVLTLADGIAVRVGLEAHVVPSHSAFLVYVLVNSRDWKSARGGSVGPLFVELIAKNSKRGEYKESRERSGASNYGQVKHLLFAATVAAARPGEYDLVVRDEQTAVVASTPITVTKDKAATWLDFWYPEKLQQQKDAPRNTLTAQWSVAAPARAQPKCNGMLPYMTRPHQGREIPLTETLPRWSFDNADGQLRLAATEKTLRVEATTAILTDASFEHWLFRVWINGKPFEPTSASSRCRVARQELEKLRDPAKVLTADWDFTAKEFGARKGDKIAVQLLYCPDGFHEIREHDGDRMKAADKMLRLGTRLPLATDKVEFVVR